MNSRHLAGSLCTIVVYAVFIYVGGTLFVPTPTHALLAIPLVCGSFLILHAVQTAQLDELGYAIMGLYATLLVVSVSLGIVETVMGSDVSSHLGGAVGTLSLSAVFVGWYAFITQHANNRYATASSFYP
ncbi:hypothetical protein [Haladaptatus cibarius]|uniref:hypothetical protein n=1 Tax=Haladaptatus cibarius TaxID=453847 RepID=UPI00067883A4|nr:hypothetical protein [Haladaptatus cibarius]